MITFKQYLMQEASPRVLNDKFWSWFGNSKALDDDGNPLVVYHATAADFDEFIPGGKDVRLSGPAIWLTDNPHHQPAMHNISSRSEKFRTGTRVIPLYVKIQKPLVIDDAVSLDWARGVFANGSSEFPQIMLGDWAKEIQRDGEYDGVIFDGEALGWKDGAKEIIVFHPNQVKSALSNTEFSDSNKFTEGVVSEIKHSNNVYSKKASHHVVSKQPVDASWAPLMTVDGYEFVWKEVGPEYRVIMKDEDGSALLRLELRVKSVRVPGGKLTGVITDSISSHEKIRGTGMALKMYKALVEHGQVLFSSNSQTSGSRTLWERLVASDVGEVFVLAEDAAARWYVRKHKYEEENSGAVLLTGNSRAMNDEAYAGDETRWLIVPHNIAAPFKKRAIELS